MRHSARASSLCMTSGRTRTRSAAGSMHCRPRRIPGTCMRRISVAAALALMLASGAFAADDIAVDVINASEPILCAEKDNVYVKLVSPDARRFTVEAVHPNYIGTIVVDRSAFDLHNCPDLAAAPVITEQPKRIP